MLRRFFTAFALITGLAAIGAPAQAAQNVAERLELGAQAEAGKAAEAQLQTRALGTALPPVLAVAPQWTQQLSSARVLTIFYGIDRARD